MTQIKQFLMKNISKRKQSFSILSICFHLLLIATMNLSSKYLIFMAQDLEFSLLSTTGTLCGSVLLHLLLKIIQYSQRKEVCINCCSKIQEWFTEKTNTTQMLFQTRKIKYSLSLPDKTCFRGAFITVIHLYLFLSSFFSNVYV